jgi:hypothetical protein
MTETYEFPIDRSKIREFARATKTRHPEYQGADPVVPPTFLTHARLAWEPRNLDPLTDLGFDLRRVLHGEEVYEFHGEPPTAGVTLEVSTRLGRNWEKEGRRGGTMRFAEVVNEFRSSDGQLVATQTTTVVETGR